MCVCKFTARRCVEEGRAHDQATMTVMLLTKQTLVSSRIGSWCSDWESFGRVGRGKGRGTHDVTHEKEDAEVVGLAQTLDALVDVLGVETMIPQAVIPAT